MTPKQRVILTQLQITGLGIIFLGFGIAWTKTWLIIFGIVLGLYGLARLFVLKKLMEQSEEKNVVNQDALPTISQSQEDLDCDLDEQGEYAKDEWESKLESYLEKRYDHFDFENSKMNSKSKPQ